MEAACRSAPSGRVHVFARVRPPSAQTFAPPCIELDEGGGTLRVRNEADAVDRVLRGEAADTAVNSTEARDFTFDSVLPTDITQQEVFAQVGLPVLRECLKGFNGTILAYGQTGSGKTHSLLHQAQRTEDVGILPRLVASLFVHIVQDPAHVYCVEAAAVQVYNEQVDDLLHPEHQSGAGQSLSVQNGGVMPGLTWVKCQRPEKLLEVFSNARANVVYAETRMNKASSRSHAIFQIRVVKRQRPSSTASGDASHRVPCTRSRLNIVDLAGSERVKRSGVEGAQFREATAINKSLLAFGNVVSALAAKKAHVPFRDSKLTRILDGSVGGNCKTALLVCVSPAAENAHETLSTLEFATRAMRVQVDAIVNESVVEVSAKDLLAELSGDTNACDSVPLQPDIEALKKASHEEASRLQKMAHDAEAKFQQEAKKREEEGMHLQKVKHDAEERRAQEAKQWADENAVLRKAAKQAEEIFQQAKEALSQKEDELRGEISRLQKAVQAAEETFRRREQEWTEEISRLQCEAQNDAAGVLKCKEEAWIEEASRLRRAAQEAEDILKRKEKEWEQESCLRDSAAAAALDLKRAEAKTLSEAYLELEGRLHEQETRTLNLQEQHAAELSMTLSRHAEEKDFYSNEIQKAWDSARDASADLEAEKVRADAAQQRAVVAEQSMAKAMHTCADAERRAAAAEDAAAKALACAAQESSMLERASAALESLRKEARQSEERLLQKHADEIKAASSEHEAEVARLHTQHTIELDAQREVFEERLSVGRRHFEDSINEFRSDAEHKQKELTDELERQQDELKKAHEEWERSKHQLLQEALERSNLQQRRLAAAFKTARCLAAEKEARLRTAHDELALRFSQRESRQEDLLRIAQQQQSLTEQQRQLQDRAREREALSRELKNRDITDRIFSSAERRKASRRQSSHSPTSRAAPQGSMPPLPGKKVCEFAQASFEERKTRHRVICRALSAGHAGAPRAQSRYDCPLSVR